MRQYVALNGSGEVVHGVRWDGKNVHEALGFLGEGARYDPENGQIDSHSFGVVRPTIGGWFVRTVSDTPPRFKGRLRYLTEETFEEEYRADSEEPEGPTFAERVMQQQAEQAAELGDLAAAPRLTEDHGGEFVLIEGLTTGGFTTRLLARVTAEGLAVMTRTEPFNDVDDLRIIPWDTLDHLRRFAGG